MDKGKQNRVISMSEFLARKATMLAEKQELQRQPIIIPEFINEALEENRHRERRLGMRVIEQVIDSSDIPKANEVGQAEPPVIPHQEQN